MATDNLPDRTKTYFIQNSRTGFIKIGKSTNPEARLASLQTANADPLILLVAIDGDHEERLHWFFDRHRVSGEWFRPNISIKSCLDFISDPQREIDGRDFYSWRKCRNIKVIHRAYSKQTTVKVNGVKIYIHPMDAPLSQRGCRKRKPKQ